MGRIEHGHVLHVLVHVLHLQKHNSPGASTPEISISPNGLKTFSLFVLVVQTAVVQMSL